MAPELELGPSGSDLTAREALSGWIVRKAEEGTTLTVTADPNTRVLDVGGEKVTISETFNTDSTGRRVLERINVKYPKSMTGKLIEVGVIDLAHEGRS